MNQINFKANFIKYAEIQKKDINSVYKSHVVSIVETDVFNDFDLIALEDVDKLWKGNVFCNIISNLIFDCDENNKIYALTEQKKDFNTLNPLKILGLMYLKHNRKNNHIYFLEAKADNTFNHIGTALIQFVQEQSDQVELFCPSSLTRQFYKKLGFIPVFTNPKTSDEKGFMYWRKVCKSIEQNLPPQKKQIINQEKPKVKSNIFKKCISFIRKK